MLVALGAGSARAKFGFAEAYSIVVRRKGYVNEGGWRTQMTQVVKLRWEQQATTFDIPIKGTCMPTHNGGACLIGLTAMTPWMPLDPIILSQVSGPEKKCRRSDCSDLHPGAVFGTPEPRP